MSQATLSSFLAFTKVYKNPGKEKNVRVRLLSRLLPGLAYDRAVPRRPMEAQMIMLRTNVSLKVSLSFLMTPDPAAQYFLQTDASDFAIGGVLRQRDADGQLRHIAFFSRKLKDAEFNYGIYDKELLALKSGLEEWRHLLIDTSIPVLI